jgi:RNA polymerase subunit RPABC4/transcription elongation factor Spt4
MKKKECPSCAMMIDEKSKVCPVCQYEFPSGMGALQWTAIALVILFVVYMILSVL